MSLNHYDELSTSFEENWFFSKDYFPTLSAAITQHLKLKDGDIFADLGCGTGNYTQAIVEQSNYDFEKIVGVDFSENMVNQFKLKNPKFEGYCSDLESFVSTNKIKFNKVLLKEVIHHIKDYNSFYNQLKRSLFPGGSILIVTRPQKTNFPFFESALQYFSDHQISEKEILIQLNEAVFKHSVHNIKIPITIAKEQLFKMIKNRFMSTFNNFSDQEIEEGLREVDLLHSNKDEISFFDELIFITGQI